MVPGRALRPVEPRRVGDGARRRRPPRRSGLGLRLAGGHPAPGRQLAQLLPVRRHRRGTQARHQRVRVHRHRCVASLPLHVGPELPRRPLAGGRAGARLGARPSPPRPHHPVGRRAERTAVGLRVAHGHVQHPARVAVRSGGRPRRRRRTARLGGGRRRVDGGDHRSPGRFRAQTPLGDGLVLPGADRRPRR